MYKVAVVLFVVLGMQACSKSFDLETMDVPYGKEPYTPTMEELEALDPVNVKDLQHLVVMVDTGVHIDVFFGDDEKGINGWVYQYFPYNEHMYRYMKLDEGVIIWQIGFYDTKELHHDYHFKKGKPFGRHREWLKNNKPLRDEFYVEGGEPDGLQQRWHHSGKIAEEKEYVNGQLLHQKRYNSRGEMVNEFNYKVDTTQVESIGSH